MVRAVVRVTPLGNVDYCKGHRDRSSFINILRLIKPKPEAEKPELENWGFPAVLAFKWPGLGINQLMV